MRKILPIKDIDSNVVLKCGRTTGTTIGQATGFMTSARKINDSDNPNDVIITVDLPIFTMDQHAKWGPFAGLGDSGAAIVGTEENFVGLLTGVHISPIDRKVKITACTPIEWLWNEVIRPQFPEGELLF